MLHRGHVILLGLGNRILKKLGKRKESQSMLGIKIHE
jgi:hypothetical protein